MDENFLLSTPTAQHIYHDIAKNMPIVDYHCHLNPQEIYEDKQYENITQVWLGGDHYKWRQMRSNGVEEKYITGDASDREKFQKWAETLEMAIGNPIYHWSHLELKKYFGYEGHLCGDTAEEVWQLTKAKLATPECSARNLILKSNVYMIGTTDDPADSLEWHLKLKEEGFPVKVCPSWRPDKARACEKPDFTDYIAKLAAAAEMEINTFADLIAALAKRLAFFVEVGCKATDHGLEYVMYEPYTAEEIEAAFAKRMGGEMLNAKEERQYKTAFMVEMGRLYAKHNIAMQLHFGVQRDLNKPMFRKLGADTGFDAINTNGSAIEMGMFLNALEETGELPKTILYSLNPADDAAIGTVIGCFQSPTTIGKIQHGAAWWFNDHKKGMTDQMTSLANLGLLGNFIGMLTDSRSFLSYARHEYFRRIMCELIGGWIENGEYPNDEKAIEKIVKGICFENAKRYFEV